MRDYLHPGAAMKEEILLLSSKYLNVLHHVPQLDQELFGLGSSI